MTKQPLQRLLIANRGEVVARIARTARRLDIESVAIYSDADREGPWLNSVDTAVPIGGNSPAESYLDIDRVLSAAAAVEADSIHPGYGFLAESAAFAERVATAGLTFVGPQPDAIRTMGSKLEAKRVARELGIPTLAEQEVRGAAAIVDGSGLRFPVLLKAAAGGGGVGIRIVDSAATLPAALELSRREAQSAFGDPAVYLEEYLPRARHLEVQVFGDGHGNVIHLFERECSIQRRHQKLIEESPATRLDSELEESMYIAALSLARAIKYLGAGTVEFLVMDDRYYFIEMNTRLQVEHPVTEEVTGLDLVQLQLEVAAGLPLSVGQAGVRRSGHSIEARLCAEVAAESFRPATGLVQHFEAPPLPGIRYELGIGTGSRITPYYDSMIAKVISVGRDREAARRTLSAALAALTVEGVETNRAYLLRIVNSPEFVSGTYDTTFVDQNPALAQPNAELEPTVALQGILALIAFIHRRRLATRPLVAVQPGWRNVGVRRSHLALDYRGTRLEFDYVLDVAMCGKVWHDGREQSVRLLKVAGNRIEAEVDGVRRNVRCSLAGDRCFLSDRRTDAELRLLPRFELGSGETSRPGALAPVPGLVVEVLVQPGAQVTEGAVLMRLEAMKMVHEILSPFDGVVVDVLARAGDSVDARALLVVVEPGSASDQSAAN